MISTVALEEAVLALLCYSDDAVILSLRLNTETFSTRVNKKIAETALSYIRKYQEAPGPQLEYLLEAELRRGEEGILLGKTLELLKVQASSVSVAFVMEQLDRFITTQSLNQDLQLALEHLSVGELEEAQKLISHTNQLHPQETNGTWLSDAEAILRRIEHANDEFISCGIPALDERGARLARKTLSMMIASTGKGKSWWLTEVGKCGLQYHHKVLHVTVELSEEKTVFRYLQNIFALTKDYAETVEVPRFERDSTGAVRIDFNSVRRDSVKSQKKYIASKLHNPSMTSLLVKEFPTSTLSTDQLGGYLDSLDREKNFRPDILIIDYADLMKIDADSLRIDTGRLYRELRGMAMQRNCAVVTASQGNRDSATTKFVSITDVAEDWSKPGTADNVYTYSQTSEEFLRGLARIKSEKVRDDRSGMTALVSQAYPFGQFAIDSVIMSAEIKEELKLKARV